MWVIKRAWAEINKALLLYLPVPHHAYLEYELSTERISGQSSRAVISVNSFYNMTLVLWKTHSHGILQTKSSVVCAAGIFSQTSPEDPKGSSTLFSQFISLYWLPFLFLQVESIHRLSLCVHEIHFLHTLLSFLYWNYCKCKFLHWVFRCSVGSNHSSIS